ncbi:MAG: sulfatase [Cyclobacteriaceae bacterium]
MMRNVQRNRLLIPFVILVLLAGCAEPKPNIIFILADDFGYMDMQAYAQKITGVDKAEMYYETPNLDRLVAEGNAFSQAYANQLCSPTRASLLTGKYAGRLGFTTATPATATYYNQNLPVPEGYFPNDAIYHGDPINIQQAWINGTSNTGLSSGTRFDNGLDEITIAEALSDYHSAFIGKWHVGGHGAKGYQPADQGFDPLAWYDAGGSVYFDWRARWNDKSKNRFPDIPQDQLEVGDAGERSQEKYLTDALTEEALNYIDDRAKNQDQPFFLYFCHFAIHSPYQAKKETIDYFDNKESKGWNGHDDPVYASMIKNLDESTGQILDKLEETGLDENTLIIFMSDNGGIDQDVAHNGIGTKNTPFVGGKACLTEGGIRVPLVFRWKGKIKPDSWSDIPVDCTDLFPTILDFAGHDLTKYYEGVQIDGQSIMGLVEDPTNVKNTYSKNTHFWHYPFNVIYRSPFDGLPLTPHSAIRKNQFKLIFDWYGRLFLYDIQKDPFEKENLVDEHPEMADALMNELVIWLQENVEDRYFPKRNPDYNPDEESREEVFMNLLEQYPKETNN